MKNKKKVKEKEINKVIEISEEKQEDESLTLDELFEEDFNEQPELPQTSEFKTDLFLKSREAPAENLEESVGGTEATEEKTENPYEPKGENPYLTEGENLYEQNQKGVYQEAEEREGVISTGRIGTSIMETITPTIAGSERNIRMVSNRQQKGRKRQNYEFKRKDQELARTSRLPEEMQTEEYKTTI